MCDATLIVVKEVKANFQTAERVKEEEEDGKISKKNQNKTVKVLVKVAQCETVVIHEWLE